MSPDEYHEVPPSVREVLAYFLNNPNAAGSERDLIETRVHQEIAAHGVAQLREAVDWLLKEQFLVPTILRLNGDRLRDAIALVEELTPRPRAVEAPVRPAVVAPRATPVDRSSPPSMPPGQLAAACLAWIDATLLRYIEHNQSLWRDAASIKRLLSPVVKPDEDVRVVSREEADAALAQAFEMAPPGDPLARLNSRLVLTPLELQALLLCLAPELHGKYQAFFGIVNDDLHGRRGATPGLLCRLLGDPLRIRHDLEQSGGLTAWRLLDHGPTLPHADEVLRVDPLVVSWLFRQDRSLESDPRLVSFVRRRRWAGAQWLPPDEAELVLRLHELMTASSGEEWIAIAGGERNGARAAIEAAAGQARLGLLRIVIPVPAPADAAEIDDVAARLARAARIADAVAVLDATTALPDGGATRLLNATIERLRGGGHPLLVVTQDVDRLVSALPKAKGRSIRIELSGPEALTAVYAQAVSQAHIDISDADAERLALAYPMTLDAIDDAIWLATLNGVVGRRPEEQFAMLAAACRRIACPELPRFGRRVDPVFRLEDVVLPKAQHDELREIVTHVRHASQVMHTWGFGEQLPYGRGVTALFSGPSGCGKTMAAQAIARELGTDAYVVDLSRVVSKYIGETEKNLDAVFNDAERAGAVLLFDEADALFGKRSEIKDAHDRYANIEVSYLLQRMESFAGSGLCVLTTNFRQNLDHALVRRLRFVIDFQKPDEKAREAIWRQCLDTDAPVARDVNFTFLARRLDLTGGTIKQIAIRAAFAAAAAAVDCIDMRHVLTAARAELLKLGLTASERELAAFDVALRGTEVA